MGENVLLRSVTAAPAQGQAGSAGAGAVQTQALPGVLLLVLVGVSLSIALGSLRPGRRRPTTRAPLLPRQRRWGVSHHERLQDPKYLGRILEAEHASTSPQGQAASGSSTESSDDRGDTFEKTARTPLP